MISAAVLLAAAVAVGVNSVPWKINGRRHGGGRQAYMGVIARTTSMRCGLGQIRLSQGSHSDSVLSGG